MSTSNRKTLMWVLLILLIATLFVGALGTAEVIVWLVLLAAWVAAYRTWASKEGT